MITSRTGRGRKIALSIFSLIVLIALTITNWQQATLEDTPVLQSADRDKTSATRLRLYLVTSKSIPAGATIEQDNVRWRWGLIRNDDIARNLDEIRHMHVKTAMGPNTPVARSGLSSKEVFPVDMATMGVLVRGDYAKPLVKGAQVVFGYPGGTLPPSTDECAYELVDIGMPVPAAAGSPITTVTLTVRGSQHALLDLAKVPSPPDLRPVAAGAGKQQC